MSLLEQVPHPHHYRSIYQWLSEWHLYSETCCLSWPRNHECCRSGPAVATKPQAAKNSRSFSGSWAKGIITGVFCGFNPLRPPLIKHPNQKNSNQHLHKHKGLQHFPEQVANDASGKQTSIIRYWPLFSVDRNGIEPTITTYRP